MTMALPVHGVAPLRFGWPLATAVFVGAMLSVYGSLFGPIWLHWMFKPLTTLMLVVAVGLNGDLTRGYTRAIFAGMSLSLLGDIALMHDPAFVVGLSLFLLAHIAYLLGMSHRIRFAKRLSPFVLVGVFSALVLATLWQSLPGPLRIPVLAYVTALGTMTAQAWVCHIVRGDSLARYAALGAGLFLLSDTLLAVNRFLQPLPLAPVWVLASYWAAQTLIAMSVNRADGSR